LKAVDERGKIEATHQQIAFALGTAREVVSRNLRRLRQGGVIETGRGWIKILKPREMS
jgi:CRP/FNR family transcriptional regulator